MLDAAAVSALVAGRDNRDTTGQHDGAWAVAYACPECAVPRTGLDDLCMAHMCRSRRKVCSLQEAAVMCRRPLDGLRSGSCRRACRRWLDVTTATHHDRRARRRQGRDPGAARQRPQLAVAALSGAAAVVAAALLCRCRWRGRRCKLAGGQGPQLGNGARADHITGHRPAAAVAVA